MSWLNEFIEQHQEFESPINFWFWSALSTVSAVMKDNVYFDKFLYKVYPNIYVMLHADSGLRKSAPISVAKKLVNGVNNTKLISGRSSIQGILKELGTAQTLPGKGVVAISTAAIFSSELSSSVVDDPAAMTILTDLYDRNYNEGNWRSLLKMESFSLKNPTISMLTATNEAHSDEFFMKKDIQGGFIARTFIIHETKRNRKNSLMFAPKVLPNYDQSIAYLKEIAALRGPFTMDFDDRVFFDNWYNRFVDTVDEQEMKDKTGTLMRIDDTILKVAMLISLGHEPTLHISRKALDEAIERCSVLIGNVRRTTMGSGKNSFAAEKKLLLIILLERPSHAITREELNRSYWMNASTKEWDEVVTQLEVAGLITMELMGNSIIYSMTDKQVEELSKHFKGK